ncbi:LysM peptidoglycan-binding domain-containing protein [Fictibacillus sp. NRS-1165]|uniref:LysM peptidoglycan-binding domain-containing protein n=1 Tax=Fictibacillus sp. NRS-1165 TaxID=3144463 RepID=UPI003D1F5833
MFFKTAALSLTAFLSMTTAAFAASPYTAKPGDSIYKIARTHQTSVKTIMNMNLLHQTMILPGQVLYVPDHSSLYNVRYGDTLYTISKKYGLSLQSLLLENRQVRNASLLYPGQIIELPSSQTTAGQTATQKPVAPETGLSANAKEVASLVNQERNKQGLSPLTLNTKLSNVAKIKATDMVEHNYFSHTSPTYSSPFDMMRTFGISYSAAGENIAEGQRSPQQVMQDWMNSPGHRQNILSSNYSQIGVGYYEGAWVQMFIR